MLQSLKRAYQVDPKNPKLHSCLIRFYQFIQENKGSWDPSVEQVNHYSYYLTLSILSLSVLLSL